MFIEKNYLSKNGQFKISWKKNFTEKKVIKKIKINFLSKNIFETPTTDGRKISENREKKFYECPKKKSFYLINWTNMIKITLLFFLPTNIEHWPKMTSLFIFIRKLGFLFTLFGMALNVYCSVLFNPNNNVSVHLYL